MTWTIDTDTELPVLLCMYDWFSFAARRDEKKPMIVSSRKERYMKRVDMFFFVFVF
jgi:hypothetical protein